MVVKFDRQYKFRMVPFKFDEQLNCNDVITASLSVTLSNIPSIVAVAKTSPTKSNDATNANYNEHKTIESKV